MRLAPPAAAARPVLAPASRVQLETIPLVLAALVGLLGLLLLWDAVASDESRPIRRERRRRERADRDRVGEAALGLGTLCMAAALAGGDSWRYGNVAVIAGTVLLVAGVALNLRYLRELLMNRGPARRQGERSPRGPEADRYVYGDAMGAAEPRPAPSAPPVAEAAPAGRPVERAADRPVDLPVERPADRPAARELGRPAGGLAEPQDGPPRS